MTDIEKIISLNLPDKEYELFWLSFKNFIIKILNIEDTKELLNLSDSFDKLQIENKYDIIKNNITDYLTLRFYYFYKLCLVTKNKEYLYYLFLNYKRWSKIDDVFNEYICDDINYLILNCLYKQSSKNNKHIDYLINSFFLLEIRDNKKEILEELFLYSIKNNLPLLLAVIKDRITDNFIELTYKIKLNLSMSEQKIIKKLKTLQ
jgi:hypothetical protein